MTEKIFGNFRATKIGKSGFIEYYVGYCSLEDKDIEDLEKAIKFLKKNKDKKRRLVYQGIPQYTKKKGANK